MQDREAKIPDVKPTVEPQADTLPGSGWSLFSVPIPFSGIFSRFSSQVPATPAPELELKDLPEDEKEVIVNPKVKLPRVVRDLSNVLVDREKLLYQYQSRIADSYNAIGSLYSKEKLIAEAMRLAKIKSPQFLWNPEWNETAAYPDAFFKELSDKSNALLKDRNNLLSYYQFDCEDGEFLFWTFRAAAAAYHEHCTEVYKRTAEKDKSNVLSILQPVSKIFGDFVVLRLDFGAFHYEPKDFKAECSLLEILKKFNESIAQVNAHVEHQSARKMEFVKELNIAMNFCKESLHSSGKNFIVDIKGLSSSVKLTPEAASLNESSERVLKDYALVTSASPRRVGLTPKPPIDPTKKSLEKLVDKAKIIIDVLDNLHVRFEEEYKKIISSIDVFVGEVKAVSQELKAAHETLVDHIRNKVNTSDYLRYMAFVNYCVVEDKAKAINKRIPKEKSRINDLFVDLKHKFRGESIDAKRDGALKEVEDLGEMLKLNVPQNREHADEMKKLRQDKLVKDLLKFIADQVLSEVNLREFWAKQNKTYLKIGGRSVNAGGVNVKVPVGIARLREDLKSRHIDALSFGEATQLLRAIKATMDQRSRTGGKGLFGVRVRKDPTEKCYELLRTLPQDFVNFDDKAFEVFKTKMGAIKDPKTNRLLSMQRPVPDMDFEGLGLGFN